MEEALERGEEGAVGRLLQESSFGQEELDTFLHKALQHGQPSCAELILKAGGSVNSLHGRSRKKSSTLITALTSGVANNSACLELLLRHGPSLESKNEALVAAARFGREDYLRLLLQHGAEANAVDSSYQNPALLLACLISCPGAVKLLLEHNANVNATNKQGDTAMHKAVANPNDDGECVRLLVQHNADLNVANNLKETPLIRAIERQSTQSVTVLIEHLCRTEEGKAAVEQALHLAASRDCHQILTVMLDNLGAASVNTLDADENTPLHLAGILASGHNRSNKIEHAKLLIERGADINRKNKLGYNPLQSNVANQASIEFLTYLIEKGGDIHNVNNQGVTPLEEAVRTFSLPALDVMLKHGGRVHTKVEERGGKGLLESLIEHRDSEGNTIVHKIASSMEYAHCLRGLLTLNEEKSKDLLFLVPNKNGDNPLHHAVRNGVWEAIETIVDESTERVLLQKNNNGNTPIDFVIEESLIYCLPYFAKKGDEWLTTEVKERIRSHRNSEGFSLLHSAVVENSLEGVQFCLQVGIDINTECVPEMTSAFATGGTPLHLAAQHGHLELIEYLLENGADVNSVAEYNNNTPAHLSAQNGHRECVRILIQKGKADITILNSDEESVRDCCEEEGLTECLELM